MLGSVTDTERAASGTRYAEKRKSMGLGQETIAGSKDAVGRNGNTAAYQFQERLDDAKKTPTDETHLKLVKTLRSEALSSLEKIPNHTHPSRHHVGRERRQVRMSLTPYSRATSQTGRYFSFPKERRVTQPYNISPVQTQPRPVEPTFNDVMAYYRDRPTPVPAEANFLSNRFHPRPDYDPFNVKKDRHK
jgi:hypothetical protein